MQTSSFASLAQMLETDILMAEAVHTLMVIAASELNGGHNQSRKVHEMLPALEKHAANLREAAAVLAQSENIPYGLKELLADDNIDAEDTDHEDPDTKAEETEPAGSGTQAEPLASDSDTDTETETDE